MAFADKREYAYWLDQSGNNNDWTSNNLTESDVMVDSPTNNFATLNPNYFNTPTYPANADRIQFSEGNLRTFNTDTTANVVSATIGMSSGKWYYEELMGKTQANWWQDVHVVLKSQKWYSDGNQPGRFANNGITYSNNGGLYKDSNSSTQTYGDSYTAGDIIGVALDMDSGKVWFAKNGTWQNSGNPATGANPASSNLLTQNDTYFATSYIGYSGEYEHFNFGQDSSFAGTKTSQGNQDGNDIGDFYYTPPTGFLALCTSNLPDVAVVPSEQFNTVLYSGNESGQSIDVNFQPDWVWMKSRSEAHGHAVIDSVRGVNANWLYTNTADDEFSEEDNQISFDSDGFNLLTGYNISNDSGQSYVAWNWKANGSGSSNTNGSINSTVSVNTDAGFSIVKYTGTGSNATIGHGLGVIPEMLIVKSATSGMDWKVYHASEGAGKQGFLNLTNAFESAGTLWQNTTPTSSLFYVNNDASVNHNTNTMIAYCFHSVEGYSKVGSYVGNGNADGPFVYTGFRPAFVLTKVTNAADDWSIADYARSPHNVAGESLRPNSNSAEDSAADIDILSNGFKVRQADSHRINYNNDTFIYIAFAETPFKYSNAR
jgi:hypothetical protein